MSEMMRQNEPECFTQIVLSKIAQLSQQEIKAYLADYLCYFLGLCDCCRVCTVVLVLMFFSSHAVCELFLLRCTGNLSDFVGSIIC